MPAPNLIVLIVGPTQEKSYKAELINLVNDLKVSAIVNFRENVPDADLVDFYKTADLFVLPSEQETLPLVIFEAMAAGCPLIATSVGGIPDVITDNVNGLLVKPGNEDELVEKMLLVLSDDTLNKKLRVQEKKTAMEYSWTKIAKKTLILYQNRL